MAFLEISAKAVDFVGAGEKKSMNEPVGRIIGQKHSILA